MPLAATSGELSNALQGMGDGSPVEGGITTSRGVS